MSDKLTDVAVPSNKGSDWVKRSLKSGHQVSAAVMAKKSIDGGRFYALAPDETPESRLDDFDKGGVVRTGALDALGWRLAAMRQRGASCLIGRGRLGGMYRSRCDSDVPSAFIEERVVCWADLEDHSNRNAAEMTPVSDGYPLNAFVVSMSASALGLADKKPLQKSFADEVARSLLAVVVAAFDAESS
jgi:hypothetical protein